MCAKNRIATENITYSARHARNGSTQNVWAKQGLNAKLNMRRKKGGFVAEKNAAKQITKPWTWQEHKTRGKHE